MNIYIYIYILSNRIFFISYPQMSQGDKQKVSRES